jgi:hypothetical protein
MATKRAPKPRTDDTPDAYSVHVSMRLHVTTRDRLDALVPVFARDPALSPTGKADRSDVIRAALEAGLQALERRHG